MIGTAENSGTVLELEIPISPVSFWGIPLKAILNDWDIVFLYDDDVGVGVGAIVAVGVKDGAGAAPLHVLPIQAWLEQ